VVTLNLDKIFKPKSIAVVGASDEEGSVGYAIIKNLTGLGYKGKVYPVNIHKKEILGHTAYESVEKLPEVVDLAIIAVPAKTVPQVVEQCGKNGEIALIMADPWQQQGLGSKMLDCMLEICEDRKLETVYGIMLPDDVRAISLMKKMGFTVQEEDAVKATLSLKGET
jgi:acetyltransferase